MNIAIFDTETTGLTLPSIVAVADQPRIIELGVIIVHDGKIAGEYNWLFNPEMAISAEITKITGITNDDLGDKPLFRQRLAEIEETFAACDMLIAHNITFDVTMLQNELRRCERAGFPWPRVNFCTAQEYVHVMGFRPRLIELYEKVMGKQLAQTHRALDDAMAIFEILEKDGFFKIAESYL